MSRQFIACFCAVQAAALITCEALTMGAWGFQGGLEGIGLWFAYGQIFILPIAILGLPGFLFVRWLGGLPSLEPLKAALCCGGIAGAALTFAVVVWGERSIPSVSGAALWLLLGGFSGVVGGWVWWRVEFRTKGTAN